MHTRYDRKALRRLREARGLSFQDLAARTKLRTQTLMYIERGITHPRVDTLAKIAVALDADITEFFITKKPDQTAA